MLKNNVVTLVLLLSMLLSACGGGSAVSSDNETAVQGGQTVNDPLEPINRKILDFNFTVDEYILRPVAVAYNENVPAPVQTGVSNFFSNLRDPFNSINNLLQGKPIKAGQDLSRFLINSTIGIAGFGDVATPIGIPKSDEDFGQTLAVWGVPAGPYVVLPFLGSSNVRDAVGTGVQLTYGDVIDYVDVGSGVALTAIRLVDTRSQFLGLDQLLDGQSDKYTFLRNFYNENRHREINDLTREEILKQQQEEEDALLDELLLE